MTTDPVSDITPDDIRRLSALLEKHDLTELRYENDDVRVTLRTAEFFRQQRGASNIMIAAPPAPLANETALEPTASDVESFAPALEATPGIRIEAPIMGVFYRTSSPADPPFVEVGDSVEVGQVVGLIEAMKVFSEIKSETAGTVREIPAQNKALVQPGDALVVLDAV